MVWRAEQKLQAGPPFLDPPDFSVVANTLTALGGDFGGEFATCAYVRGEDFTCCFSAGRDEGILLEGCEEDLLDLLRGRDEDEWEV